MMAITQFVGSRFWFSFSMLGALLLASSVFADTPNVAVTGVPLDQDTTITVRKGDSARTLDPPDYRIDSGTEEITGDPVAGQKGSYESWKAACTEWKKDMREMNGKALIALSCGTPHSTRDKSMLESQTSTGTYKLKIRVRDTLKTAASKT